MWFIDCEGLAARSFLLTSMVPCTGRLPDRESSHTHTDTQKPHSEECICATLSVRTSPSLFTSHTDVPLGTSAGCGRVSWGGWGRGFSGVHGAVEGQTGPQSPVESFLCGTQSIVCVGKGHEDGTPPRAGH